MKLIFSRLCELLDLECITEGTSEAIAKVVALPFTDEAVGEWGTSCVAVGTLKDYLRADSRDIRHFICTSPLSAETPFLGIEGRDLSVAEFLSRSIPEGNSFACVKREIPTEELMHLIENELKIAKRLTDDALRLYECLSDSTGIQKIIDTAGELLNNPILVANNSFVILGYTRNISYHGEMWRSVVEDACFPTEYLEVADHKFYDVVYKRRELTVLSDPPEWGTIYLSKSLNIGTQSVGFVSLIQSTHTFQRYDFELFKVLRDVLSIAVSRDESLGRSYSELYMYVIEALLTGHFSDANIGIRLAQADFTPLKYLNAIAVQFGKKRIYTPAHIQNKLESLIPCARGVVYADNSIGMLAMRNNDGEAMISNEGALLSFLEECDMTLGISETFFASEISLTPQYYEQAQVAIYLHKKLNDQRRCCFHKDYLHYHILDNLEEKEDLRMFFHYKLQEILDYDRSYGTAYAITLYHYITQGYSALKASQILKIHRNTLDYRINKLKELFSVDMNDYDLLRAFFVSFTILSYKNPDWMQKA